MNINLHTDLVKYITGPQEHTTNDEPKAKNELINQGVKKTGIQYYNTHQELIISDIVSESDIYDNFSYAPCANWEIE